MGGKRQKFPNIGWLVKLQSFKSNETYFKFNSCLKKQPMQLNKCGGGRNPRGQVEYKPCNSIQDKLNLLQDDIGEPNE